jgi:ribose transport system substrate-binding protein
MTSETFGRDASRRDFLKFAGIGIGTVVGGAALAACSSSGSNSGGSTGGTVTAGGTATGSTTAGVAAAAAAVAAVSKVPTFTPVGPAIDVKPLAGKTIMYLTLTLAVDIVQTWARAVEAAGAAAGVKIVKFDGKDQATEFVRGINQAISQKVDCLLIDSIPSMSLVAPIKAAKAAGVKVIILNERPANLGGPLNKDADAGVSQDYAGAAELELDWVIADSGGDASVAVFRLPNALAHTDMVNRIKTKAKAFPKLKIVGVEQVDASEWQTRLPVLTQTYLTRYPDLKYFIPLVDGMALPMVSGIQQAGKTGKVNISTFNATPSVMKLLKDNDTVGLDVGGPPTWEGWAYVDQALRVMAGAAPVDERIPLRSFDRSDIGSININGNQDDWYGTQAAIDGYKKLWGVS